MRQIIELDNSKDAAELVRRLNASSLSAVYTEVAYGGEGQLPISRSIVWIGDDDDMTIAARIVDDFREERE